MELAALIEGLANPAAYSFAPDTVDIHQTHISAVFLAGPYAYKIKKPVNLGFLDFSTLDKRRFFCEEEVRLNRRLAPQVYLGVVPVKRTAARVHVEGDGTIVEWAVQMQRLPDAASLEKRLERGEVGVDRVQALARKVASFHAQAAAGPHIAEFGRFEIVARNARENFDQSAAQIGSSISQAVFDRLRTLTDEALVNLHALIKDRATRGVPRDTHGDLHLDHVYLFPELLAPNDLIIIDCIEFNARFRFADPVADMAFLVMDLMFHNRRDLANAFAAEYFQAAQDEEGRALLPFYTAYRAAVRGKVEGLELLEKEVPESEREAALVRARAHWLLALGELDAPRQRPCLVLVGGFPGTGKSTLAQSLAERAGFRLIRSDVVRKELAGVPAQGSAQAAYGAGIYDPAWTERTYAECLNRAERLLFEGQRVVLDANFGEERHRQAFISAATALGVPALFFRCQAHPNVVRRRLDQRRGDASDADWAIYRQASERWEELGPVTQDVCRVVPTDARNQGVSRAIDLLGKAGLWDE